MTALTVTQLPNGDIMEVRTNLGCAPIVYINGVIQPLATMDYVEPLWSKWFAWRPVRVNGKWYWLTHIYRKFSLSPGGGFYTYGDDFDILRDTR